MSTARRVGKRTLSVEVPEELARRLDELLRQTRRSVTAEIALALEFWLDRQGVGESAVEQLSTAEDKPRGRRLAP
jgi:predicted transcriptional regulator